MSIFTPYSYDRYRAMTDELERLRGRAERAREEAGVLASVRAEGLEPSPFGHALAERVIEGMLTHDEAIAELDRHYRHPRSRQEGNGP